MFNKFSLFSAILLSALTSAAPTKYPTEEESRAELQAAGMTQGSIDGLSALTHRFASGYPLVQANKEQTDKFIADYTNDATNFVKAMPDGDQTIYHNYLVKYGIA